jgi:hypothetical protein
VALALKLKYSDFRLRPKIAFSARTPPQLSGSQKIKDCEECTNFEVLDNPPFSLSGLWRPDSRDEKMGLKNYLNTNQVPGGPDSGGGIFRIFLKVLSQPDATIERHNRSAMEIGLA